jgi:predicted metal-binding membrane protein
MALTRFDFQLRLMSSTPLEVVLKRDRVVVLGGLVIVAALAWVYLFYQAHSMQPMNMDGMNMSGMDMTGMDMGMSMAMPQTYSWGVFDLLLIFTMWAVMMVAMMVPTTAPMVLLFATTNRKRLEQRKPFVSTAVFLSGYLVVWTGFAVFAALAQWLLHNKALMSAMMVSTSAALGGVLLLAAGIFQWTPLKNTCLSHCRSPLDFVVTHWREGRLGAFLMGCKHGIYCVGCCWVLMSILFVTGVMNLFWVALIAGFVLLEKIAPRTTGPWVSRFAGLLLVGWGVWMLAGIR